MLTLSLSFSPSLALSFSHLFRFCCCQELPAAVQAKAKVKNAQKADQNSHTCDSAVVFCSSFLLPTPVPASSCCLCLCLWLWQGVRCYAFDRVARNTHEFFTRLTAGQSLGQSFLFAIWFSVRVRVYPVQVLPRVV